MNKINDGKTILKIFEENGFDAYIVGGAVRDYLLKLPINDVDITTNARPKEVLKLFKGIPTGIKYGTVTIKFKNNDYEVTTFRSERRYDDMRHPEEIEFEDSVLKDIQRRDFTINGMLMDKKGLIIDHVGGKNDVKNKIIKTIGIAQNRFNEDALRILRAFYFQAKLDFIIDLETKKAILDNRNLISLISAERILEEIIKMIKEKNFKKALESMVETKINEELPGLEKGILFFSQQDKIPSADLFFMACFTLENKVPLFWKFSNKIRHKYECVVKLANENKISKKQLYDYGLEYNMTANRVNFILNKDKLRSFEIEKQFNLLPITSSMDLKFKAPDILKIINKKQGAWINNLINHLIDKVLNDELKNDHEELKKYVIENQKRF